MFIYKLRHVMQFRSTGLLRYRSQLRCCSNSSHDFSANSAHGVLPDIVFEPPEDREFYNFYPDVTQRVRLGCR